MTLDELKTLVKRAEEKLRDYAKDDDDDAWDTVRELDAIDWTEFYDDDELAEKLEEAKTSDLDTDVPDETFRSLVRSGALSHNEAAALTYRGLCELVEDVLA